MNNDKMSYYRTCPKCGTALDPGEICEYEKQERKPVHTEADALKREINRLMKTASLSDLGSWRT